LDNVIVKYAHIRGSQLSVTIYCTIYQKYEFNVNDRKNKKKKKTKKKEDKKNKNSKKNQKLNEHNG